MLKRILLIIGTAGIACGAEPSNAEGAYKLFVRDMISFSVYGESSLGVDLRLAGNGAINVPLIGAVNVAGLTLAEAERKIQDRYIAEDILIRPQVTLQVKEYSKKEISVLGQVGKQGKIELPAESVSLTLVEALTSAGGFTRIAKGDAVRITRKDLVSDEEKVFTINAERMIAGRSPQNETFLVLPGDVIFVPERLF